jgi:TPR repeat protein
MYYNGWGVPQDYSEAVKWYRKAAEQGDVIAQYNLGDMYCTGEGVPQNDAEAVKWYRKAAEQGDAAAQHKLGRMYVTGVLAPPTGSFSLGVSQDIVQAYLWFSIAATQGSEGARWDRDIAARQMTPDQIAEAQRLAREWMAKHPQ